MTWRREDSAYAAAAIAAAAVVVYFVIGNFGLVPSLLSPGRTGGASAIDVPNLAAGTTASASTSRQRAAAAVPPTTVRPLPAAPPTRPAVDRTPPTTRITTANGAQLSLTTPSTVNGTASDADSGIRAVTVTFTRSSGGGGTMAPADVTCTNVSRRTCTWSANVPTVAGQYTVTARAADRQGNVSRAVSISITVVNGGDLVSTVTNLLGGLVGAL